MGTYLLSLITAALVATLIGILSPDGTGGGLSKHMRLLTALFLLCIMIAPLKETIMSLSDLANGTLTSPDIGEISKENYQKELESAMNSSSKVYLVRLLTKTLEKQFSIQEGEIRCTIRWNDSESKLTPEHVTIILSGRAIWLDPDPIEQFVSDLFGCACVTAIE